MTATLLRTQLARSLEITAPPLPSDSRDGGPAFPHDNQELGDSHRMARPGMSLRDYFAAAALVHAYTHQNYGAEDAATSAHLAYQLADAMLAERGAS